MIEIQNISEVVDHIDGLQAVIFDLDDTLYPEKEYVRSGYHEVAKLLPMISDAEEKLWNAFESRLNAIDTVLHEAGVYNELLKKDCLNAYRAQSCPDIHLYPGVKVMLNNLRRQDIKLGIITDGRPEGQHAKISTLGLENVIDKIIVTDELGGVEFRKPCEKAFTLMQETFRIPFEQMAYVGDNTKKDFIASEKLGMRSIWLKNVEGLYN